MGERIVGGFQQGIDFEAHVAIIALGVMPDGKKLLLCRRDDLIGERPSRVMVGQSFVLEQTC